MSAANRSTVEEVLELIYSELLARQAAGDNPSAAEFIDRYPEHRAAIVRLLELHRALGASLSPQELVAQATLGGDVPTLASVPSGLEPTLDSAQPAMSRAPAIGAMVRYFGNYELLAEIARGGMGVVYKARQVQLRRVVALKMILSGQFAGVADVQRFHTEAEAAAQLDHPGIVPVFEVGEHQGLHYFSMGYVDGPPLSAQLVHGPLAPRAAAEVVAAVANAVHYAHGKGVIHRDLKPGNILIDKSGQPRITDFGLAKRTAGEGASDLTGTGQILGTPSYMPPEQAIGQSGLIREPADIYALGAVLYATLIGRPPFQADNPLDTLRMVLEREPVPPRQLNASVPADLETICLKCLEKNPARRYATAQSLADELRRFLRGEPILARPVGPLTRAWRWCQRNRAVAALLAAVAASLLIGTVVSSYFAWESDRRADENFDLAEKNKGLAEKESKARGEADKRKLEAEEKTRLALRESANLALNEAERHCENNEGNVGVLWMARAHGMATEAQDAVLADACRIMVSAWLNRLPRFEKRVASPFANTCVADFGHQPGTIIYFHRGQSTGYQGLKILDAETGGTLFELADVKGAGRSLPLNQDHSRILLEDKEGRIRMWSLVDRDWVGAELKPVNAVWDAVFSPRGDLIATTTKEGRIELWSALDGKPTGVSFDHPQPVEDVYHCAVAFDATGASVLSGGYDSKLQRNDARTGQLIGQPLSLGANVTTLRVSPDGNRVAVGGSTNASLYWLETPLRRAGTGEMFRNVDDLDFSADGSLLMEVGRGNQLAFRDGKTAAMVSAPALFSNWGLSCRFDASSRRALISTRQALEYWRVPDNVEDRNRRIKKSDGRRGVRINAESMLAQGVDGIEIQLPLAGSEEGLIQLPENCRLHQLTRDGRYAVAATAAGEIVIADRDSGAVAISTEKHFPPPLYLSVAPGGNCLVSLNEETVRLWHIPTGNPRGSAIKAQATIRDLSFDHAGSLAAIHDRRQGTTQVVRTADGSFAGAAFDPGAGKSHLAGLTAGGSQLVVLRGSSVELWDRSPPKLAKKLGSHDAQVYGLEICADGRHCVTVGSDGVIRFWDIERGGSVGTPIRNVGTNVYLHPSPDTRILAAQPHLRDLSFYHIPSGRKLYALSQKNGFRFGGNLSPAFDTRYDSPYPFCFSEDSRLFVNTKDTSSVLFLNTPQDHAQLQLLVETWTGLELDGSDVRVLKREDLAKRQKSLLESPWQQDADGPDSETLSAEAERRLQAGIETLARTRSSLNAVEPLHRALELQLRLLAHHPNDPVQRARLGRIYFRIGLTYRYASRSSESQQWFDKAIQELEAAVAHPQATPKMASSLLIAAGNQAFSQANLATLQQLLEREQELRTRLGDDVALKVARARLLFYLANRTGNPEDDLPSKHFDECQRLSWEVYESPEAARMDRHECILQMATYTSNLAGRLCRRPAADSQRQAAKEFSAKVLDTFEKVYRDDPGTLWHGVNLSLLHHQHACFFYYESNWPEAAKGFERSFAITQEMLDRKQLASAFRKHRLLSLANLAATLALTAADDAGWKRVLSLCEQCEAEGVDKQRGVHCYELLSQGIAHLHLGDAAGAKEAIEKGISLEPPDAADHFWLAAVRYKQGEREQGDLDWAAGEKWLAENPGNEAAYHQMQRDLARKFRPATP